MRYQQKDVRVERLLKIVGALWFIVYKYDKKKYFDKLSACTTFKSRLSEYEESEVLHRNFIERVLKKDPKKLGKTEWGYGEKKSLEWQKSSKTSKCQK